MSSAFLKPRDMNDMGTEDCLNGMACTGWILTNLDLRLLSLCCVDMHSR